MINWTKIVMTLIVALAVNAIVFQIMFSEIIIRNRSIIQQWEFDHAIENANNYNDLVDAINRMRK